MYDPEMKKKFEMCLEGITNSEFAAQYKVHVLSIQKQYIGFWEVWADAFNNAEVTSVWFNLELFNLV